MIGISVAHEGIGRRQAVGRDAVVHLSDPVQIGTGDHGARLIHDAYHPVDRIFHLIHNALKNSVRHNVRSPFLSRRRLLFVKINNKPVAFFSIVHNSSDFCNIF